MTSTVTLNPGYFAKRSWADWGFALLAVLGMAWAFARYGSSWAQVGEKITGNDYTGAARQGASTGYLTGIGQDWMGDAFLDLWQSEGVDASRVTRHPTAPTGVSFVTHSAAGHKFDYLRKNSAASLMTPETLAADWLQTPHARGWLTLPRVATPHHHGTGCTFASGLAAALALGWVPADAAVLAKMLTTHALRRAQALGRGGPGRKQGAL